MNGYSANGYYPNGLYENTSRDYARIIFRHLGVMIAAMVTMMATVIVGVLCNTPVYEAQVKLLITGQKHTQADYYTDIGLSGARSAQMTLTQSEIVTSDPVIERAVAVL